MKQRTMPTRARRVVSLGLLAVLLTVSQGAAQESAVTPTNIWMDVYGSHSSFAGAPIPAGSYVAVFDSQGVQCGELIVETPGALMPVMPCYGDVSSTPADEGAVDGDQLTFTVNGTPAVTYARSHYFEPVPADTPITWKPQDLWEVDLFIPPQPHLTISQVAGQTQLTWQPAAATTSLYQVWQSTDFYFIPGAEGATLLGTVPATGAPLVWYDSAGVGDPAFNYAYRVVSLNDAGQVVGISQAVGEFDFAQSQ